MQKSPDLLNAIKLISRQDPDKIALGLDWFAEHITTLESEDFRQALQAVASVFTYDTYENPEYQTVVNKAVTILATQGELSIPYMLEMLSDSDFKVEFNLAVVLGKIGGVAVNPLIEAYKTSRHPAEKAFIIYALGKICDHKIIEAYPLMIEALEDSDREVRDSAARSLGKMCTAIKPEDIPRNLVDEIFGKLIAMTQDEYSGVRSKAIRSLGRLSDLGFLSDEQNHKLQTALADILGRSGDYIWDSAFIVRREAEAVYKQMTGEAEV